LLPQALPLSDWKEWHYQPKINLFLLDPVPLLGGKRWQKEQRAFVRWIAIADNVPGSLAKCEERAFCQTEIIRCSKGYFLAYVFVWCVGTALLFFSNTFLFQLIFF
jgi:hypothetical protein